MAVVEWTPNTVMRMETANILFQEPTSALKAIKDEYKDAMFLKCPAFLDECRNVFVVCAPVDIVLTVDKPTLRITLDRYTQEYMHAFHTVREDGAVTCPPAYIFASKESIIMESLPAFLLNSPSTENTLLVPGRFDISKWVRGVDWTFFLKDYTKPVTVKRGDPLFFIRFTPADGSKVELRRMDEETAMQAYAVTNACVGVKYFITQLPLQTAYELASSFVGKFTSSLGRKSKCPFGFGGKK